MGDRDVVIRFTDSGGDSEAEISLALDEEANDGKLTFSSGQYAFIQVTRNPHNSYTMETNGEEILQVATSVPATIEETLTFCGESSKTLQHYPTGAPTVEYIGDSPGVVMSIEGKTVTFPSDVIATVKLTYTYLFDRWRLLFNEEGTAIVLGRMGDVKGCLTVPYEGEAGPVDIDLQVLDYCTDSALPTVSVYLDGVYVGDTDSSGRINLGELERGTTHSIRMVKSGYIDSDIDSLRNDEFTVPTED